MELLRLLRPREGSISFIDLGYLDDGLNGEGVPLEVLKKYLDYPVIQGITLKDVIHVFALMNRVRVDYTRNGLALKYFDADRIEGSQKARIDEGALSRIKLQIEGILPIIY